MKQWTQDERAVRGAAELAAKMYVRALVALGIMLAVKVLMIALGWYGWLILLTEAVTLPVGIGVVLVRRIRLGLWGRMDDAMQELLHRARGKAFELMCWTSLGAAILGFILLPKYWSMCQLPAMMLSFMHSDVREQCVRAGWYHGLARPMKRKTAIVQAVLVVFALVGLTVVQSWVGYGERMPLVVVIVVLALLLPLVIVGTRNISKPFQDSEIAADAQLHGEERRAERGEADEE